MSNNMDMTNNEIFRLGMKVGRKQLADHIVHQFEMGKPVEINGELYWLKDAKQNLMDIMDDIESAWDEEQALSVFIVASLRYAFNPKELRNYLFIKPKENGGNII